jgi:hypothetical protein
MRVFRAAMVIALLTGPAYAQNPIPRYGEAPKDKSAQEIAAERAAEKAYQRSLGNIPDKGATDPWGTIRSESAPKPAAKATPVKKTKTGETAQ